MDSHTNRSDEHGIALATVLLGSLVALLLAMAMITFATGSISSSRNDQNWNAALASAEAGVDDYIYRLNRNTEYWRYGVGTGFTSPTDGNTAFAVYTDLAGAPSQSTYRYRVDQKPNAGNGATIKLTSTGRVRGQTRTIQTTLRRRGFLDFLYYTDFETKDPALYVRDPLLGRFDPAIGRVRTTPRVGYDYYTIDEASTNCNRYQWQGRPSPECVNIVFGPNDQVNGPLHTNDTIRTESNTGGWPRFNGAVTTLRPGGGYLRGGSATPTFQRAGDPKNEGELKLPGTNGALQSDARIGVPGMGCLYTGPTRIKLNSDGTMNVWSPFTRPATATPPGTNPGCGPGLNLARPANGVIYVQNVPIVPGDPNYRPGCTTYPKADLNPSGLAPEVVMTNDVTTYRCQDGDVFVQGDVNGAWTIGAQNNVIITNDLRYVARIDDRSVASTNPNMLGLIGENFVEVYHPVNSSGTNLTTELQDLKVHAAILAIKHSFRVQKYEQGDGLGTLTVLGAIGQKYRGIVRRGTTGYAKDYIYDDRLKYSSPPSFLNPEQSAWQVVTWSEVKKPSGW